MPPRDTVEGSLTIARSGDSYVAKFVPYAVGQVPAGPPLALPDREAVARFLQQISTDAARIVEIMDDLRQGNGVFLPVVIVTTEQRRTLRF